MATTKKRTTKKQTAKKQAVKPTAKASKPEELVAAPPAPTEPTGDVVELAEEQKGVLRSINERLSQVKLDIANMTMQRAMLEARLGQAVQAAAELEKSYGDRVGEIAREHGVGSNPQSQWQFDVDTLMFRRVKR